MASPEGIPKVDNRTVLLSERCLNASLRHHRIGVTHPELGCEKDAAPLFCRKKSRSNPRPSSAKDQDINIMVGILRKIPGRRQPTPGFENVSQLLGNNRPFIGTNF